MYYEERRLPVYFSLWRLGFDRIQSMNLRADAYRACRLSDIAFEWWRFNFRVSRRCKWWARFHAVQRWRMVVAHEKERINVDPRMFNASLRL